MNSETLFHYTKSLDSLESILNNGFQPRFCPEELLGGTNDLKHFLESLKYPDTIELLDDLSVIGIPMVCFCDIKLKDSKEHSGFYGEYSIGLSKDWARKYTLSTVLYKSENSAISHIINDLFSGLVLSEVNNCDKCSNILKQFNYHIWELINFIKPFKGKIWDWELKSFCGEDKVFYNEREWRWVPPIFQNNRINNENFPTVITKGLIEKGKLPELNNILANRYQLPFELSDINYIIVNKQDEIKTVTDLIGEISLINKTTFDGLILSKKQLINDFI